MEAAGIKSYCSDILNLLMVSDFGCYRPGNLELVTVFLFDESTIPCRPNTQLPDGLLTGFVTSPQIVDSHGETAAEGFLSEHMLNVSTLQ